MCELKKLLEQYAAASKAVRLQLQREIDAIEENEQIRRIGGNCFTIQFSELKNWNILSAEFYDFSLQKERLKQVLASTDTLESQLKRLFDVAKTGKMKIYSGYGNGYTMPFHPKVCQSLRGILDDLFDWEESS